MISTRGRCSLAAHEPHWSAGRCPRPGSAPLPSLWQREVGTDWWSVSGGATKKQKQPQLAQAACCLALVRQEIVLTDGDDEKRCKISPWGVQR